MRKPSGLVEAAVRVLGTMLVLYRHYVPNSEYYTFTTQSFSRQRWYDGDLPRQCRLLASDQGRAARTAVVAGFLICDSPGSRTDIQK